MRQKEYGTTNKLGQQPFKGILQVLGITRVSGGDFTVVLTVSAKEHRLTVMAGGYKWSVEKAAAIVARVSNGSTLPEAARAEHITSETARNWMKWGMAGKEPYQDFPTQIQVAREIPRAEAMESWRVSAAVDWRAAKGLVEYLDKRNRDPNRFADQIEAILDALEAVLGADKAKEVLRAIVERTGGEAVGDSGAALRLVSGE